MAGTSTFEAATRTLQSAHPRVVEFRSSLSVIVPCHQESAGIPELANRLRTFAATEGRLRVLEFIFVDDGSSDDTFDLLVLHCGDLPGRILRHPQNLGLTHALKTGSATAEGALIGWLDADLTYAPEILTQLAAAVDRGADIAVASCHHPEGRIEGVSWFRARLSRLASHLYRVASGRRLWTFTCMVRVHQRAVLAGLTMTRSGFLGVTESLLQALAEGRTVVEVPATLCARQRGSSKMRVVRTGLQHLALMLAALRGRLGRAG